MVTITGAALLTGCSRNEPAQPQRPANQAKGGRAVPSPAPKPAPRPTPTPTPTAQVDKDTVVEAKFQKAKLSWADDKGQPLWDAQFREAVATQSGGRAIVELRTVSATLYRNGKPASVMTAPLVVADATTKQVRASGGVQVTSLQQNAIARCQTLVWKSKADRIVGTGGVKMKRGNITIVAKSFESDTALNRATFTEGQVSVR